MSNTHWVSKLIMKKKAKYFIHSFYTDYMSKYVGYIELNKTYQFISLFFSLFYVATRKF